jgi:hypothetical protein
MISRPLLSLVALAGFLLVPEIARAENPTVEECLSASEGAVQSGQAHKLRAARARYIACSAPSCPGEIKKECVARVDQISRQIPTILFVVKDGSGADLAAVSVAMDGESLADRLDGTALAVDPGKHTFTFAAVGYPIRTKTIFVHEAEKDLREELIMQPAASARPLPVAVMDDAPKGGLGTARVVALVLGGVGVVGLGLGAAFGGVALSQKSSAEVACPGAACATRDGSNDWSHAALSGDVSTVGFIVGAAALAGGLTLWLAAPARSGTPPPKVGIGPGTLELRGAF